MQIGQIGCRGHQGLVESGGIHTSQRRNRPARVMPVRSKTCDLCWQPTALPSLTSLCSRAASALRARCPGSWPGPQASKEQPSADLSLLQRRALSRHPAWAAGQSHFRRQRSSPLRRRPGRACSRRPARSTPRRARAMWTVIARCRGQPASQPSCKRTAGSRTCRTVQAPHFTECSVLHAAW